MLPLLPLLPLLKQLPQHSWCYMQSWCIQLNAVKLLPLEIQLIPSFNAFYVFFSLQFRLFWSHTAQHLLCIEQFTVQNLRFSLNLFVSIHSFLFLSLSLFAWILLIFFHSIFFYLSLYHTHIHSFCLSYHHSFNNSLFFGKFKDILKKKPSVNGW